MLEVTIYTDGSCHGNPGPGGYAAVMIHDGKGKELSGGYRLTTNNRMELLAALEAFKALKEPCKVHLHVDSKYVQDGLEKGWAKGWRKKGWKKKGKPTPNADLWAELLDAVEGHDITYHWVRGHTGDPGNERCDVLANAQSEKAGALPVDPGYPPPAGGYPHLVDNLL